uniref:Sulfatase N-terminal domain-containing protein n=1 Tax=Timema tahoe TaxID=61484 RepID=A0A7R9FL78_9NEOP|nr:unnamed protein product [Timema tahoe]
MLTVFSLFCLSYCQNRSNIVVILTDDQDLTLGGLTPMIKTQSLIGSMGATFTNAFVTTPVCCPSRSSILTGVYLHNHGTVNNSVSGGCSSKSWQATQEPRSFSVPIHSAGYTTFYAGKYLNQYGKPLVGGAAHVPPGWDWWVGLEGNSVYYNYTLSVNGTSKEFTNQYLTNVILDYGLEFLRSQRNTSTNFFMLLATPACHAPFTPEPKYKDYFSDVQVMKTPNFNISNTTSKHWLLRMSPTPLPGNMLPTLDDVYRNRWKTLLTVDDMVETVISELNNLGILNDTYIVFTSDHGYHVGQFSLPWDKRQPYESDIRVPLLIRGPNISTNKLVTQPVLSIDLAPTLLEMAGLDPPDYMDGVSYLSFLTDERVKVDWERVFLVEYHGEGETNTVDTACPLPRDDTLAQCVLDEMCKCQDSKNNTYTCVRHLSQDEDFIFCQFYDDENFQEAYNLHTDPYQLDNLAQTLDTDNVSWYTYTLSRLKSCSGTSCHVRNMTLHNSRGGASRFQETIWFSVLFINNSDVWRYGLWPHGTPNLLPQHTICGTLHYMTPRIVDTSKPPNVNAWLAQCCLYIAFMVIVKIFITLLIQLDFWDSVRDFILSPITNPRVELAIVMLIIPFIVNILMFWVTDNFLMRHSGRKSHSSDNGLLHKVKYRYRKIRKDKRDDSESEGLLSGDEELLGVSETLQQRIPAVAIT